MDSIALGHHDVVYSTAYNFYGTRMATCSADHTIRVFDKVNGKWEFSDGWQAHDAAVVQVSWAGPEYAQVLASASHDCTARIWEEDGNMAVGSGKRWRPRYTISDFKGPVYDVAFSPSYTSLKLGCIAADGVLRVYEAVDPSSVSYWAAIAEIPLLSHPIARQLQSSFALAWCPSLIMEDYLVVCVLEDALVYKRDPQGGFKRVTELTPHKGLVRDVSWAPSMGRSFQLIATACKDGYMRIFKLTAKDRDSSPDQLEDVSTATELDQTEDNDGHTSDDYFHSELLHQEGDFGGEVWRVTWNACGTILAATGSDGQVRLYKLMPGNRLQRVADLSVESEP